MKNYKNKIKGEKKNLNTYIDFILWIKSILTLLNETQNDIILNIKQYHFKLMYYLMNTLECA